MVDGVQNGGLNRSGGDEVWRGRCVGENGEVWLRWEEEDCGVHGGFLAGTRKNLGWGYFALVVGVLNSKRIMLPNLVGRDPVCNQPVFQSFLENDGENGNFGYGV